MSAAATRLGTAYVTALAQKDWDGVARVLADDIDFRALTPRRDWQMTSAKDVVHDALSVWFDDGDEIVEVLALQVRPVVGERSLVSYRLRVRNADGDHVVEQQAYFDCNDSGITFMRVLCSGYLPV